MNKACLEMLERARLAEVNCARFQSRSKVAKKLCKDGYLQEVGETTWSPLGTLTMNWYELTCLGRLTFCVGHACKESSR